MTKTLYMTKGLPGSGKSTWAREYIDSVPYPVTRINKDDLRAMLHNGKWSKANEKQVVAVRDLLVIDAMERGYTVIVDDTNFAPVHEDRLRHLAKQHNYSFTVRDFTDVPVQTCIERDLKRVNSVGKDVIIKMYDQYLRPATPTYVAPLGAPHAALVDIDGTLALNLGGRSPFEWHRVGEDTVNEPVAMVVRALATAGMQIVVMSGRDAVCEPETVAWLVNNRIPFDSLIMRRQGDMRKDSIVKRELFEKYVADTWHVQFVIDDRQQVVNMWRNELGLTVFQCAEGNF